LRISSAPVGNVLPRGPWGLQQAEQRYKKIITKPEEIDRLFVGVLLQAHVEAAEVTIVDVDAADGPLDGNRKRRFFHGCYRTGTGFGRQRIRCSLQKRRERQFPAVTLGAFY
jgi:hypothetical protein